MRKLKSVLRSQVLIT